MIEEIEKFVNQVISEEENDFNQIIFSVHDHWLSREEAENTLMCYAQALSENKLQKFKQYEDIYLKAFKNLYENFYSEILFYTIYENVDFEQADHFFAVRKYPDGTDTFYESKNLQDFLSIIEHNIREQLPFRNIVFKNHKIFIDFRFDLTFRLLYSESDKYTAEVICKIFLENGFNIIENRKNKT